MTCSVLKAVLLAVALACFTATAALGNTFNFSMIDSFAFVSEGNITLEAEGTNESSCLLTLTGGFSSGWIEVEVIETSVGSVSEITVGACAEGQMRRLLGSPWAIQAAVPTWLLSAGRLPENPERIDGVLVIVPGVEILITKGANQCLYRGRLALLTELTQIAVIGTERWFRESSRYTLLAEKSTLAWVATLAGTCKRSNIKFKGTFAASGGRQFIYRP